MSANHINPVICRIDSYDQYDADVDHSYKLSDVSMSFKHSLSTMDCLKYAEESSNETDYILALFCLYCKPNIHIEYYRNFIHNREFNLLLKIRHASAFDSIFPRYNEMNIVELKHELGMVRKSMVMRCIDFHNHPRDSEFYNFLFNDPDMRFTIMGDYIENYSRSGYDLNNFRQELLEDILSRGSYRSSDKEGEGSYPERFTAAVLDRAGIPYMREVVFPWSKGQHGGNFGSKRYDFYIPSKNAIIEVNGAQHYREAGGKFHRSLKEEQENDFFKRNLARINGINTYIIIDARSSDPTFMKNSLEGNQDFQDLVNLNHINWNDICCLANREYSPDVHMPVRDFYIDYEKEWLIVIDDVLRSYNGRCVDSYLQDCILIRDVDGCHAPLKSEEFRLSWGCSQGIFDPQGRINYLVYRGLLNVECRCQHDENTLDAGCVERRSGFEKHGAESGIYSISSKGERFLKEYSGEICKSSAMGSSVTGLTPDMRYPQSFPRPESTHVVKYATDLTPKPVLINSSKNIEKFNKKAEESKTQSTSYKDSYKYNPDYKLLVFSIWFLIFTVPFVFFIKSIYFMTENPSNLLFSMSCVFIMLALLLCRLLFKGSHEVDLKIFKIEVKGAIQILVGAAAILGLIGYFLV